jgi:ferredoxin
MTPDPAAREALVEKARRIAEERAKKPPRKKTPPKLAVINQTGCTGCEACIVFCPVDCIEIVPGAEFAQFQQVVEVDLERCIGCALCSKHCPWDTIPMLPTEEALRSAPELTLRSVIGQKTRAEGAPPA